jgi:hypothetical protein
MKCLTIRGVEADLARSLAKARKRTGKSLNQTVLDLLRQALGLDSDKPFSNGLAKLAGTWSEEDLKEFHRNTAFLSEIDEEMWK